MELIDTARAVQLYRALGSRRRDERRLGGQHDVRRRQLRRACGLHRQGLRRRPRGRLRARPQRRRRRLPPRRAASRHADGAVHHRRHGRRPAHDEHLSRCVQPPVGRRPRRGDDRRRCRAVHGGLPVRPRRRQEGVPAGRGRGPRQRAQGLVDAVGLVLRRPPPARLRRPRARRGGHPVRQRRRAVLAVRAGVVGRGDRRCAGGVRAGGDHPRQGRLVRRHRRRRRPRPRPTTSSGSSTRRAPGISTRRASCSGTRSHGRSTSAPGWGRWRPARSSAMSARGHWWSCERSCRDRLRPAFDGGALALRGAR